MKEFQFDVFELDPETMELVQTGTRKFVRGDWEAIRKFTDPTRPGEICRVPVVSSGLNLRDCEDRRISPRCLGILVAHANDVYRSKQVVCLTSTAYSDGCPRNVSLCPDNFLNAIAYFAARHLSPNDNWLYTDDEFHVPDEDAPGYKQWRDSAVIYAMLHSKNQCTSLRDLDGPVPRFHNHMFWFTYEEAGEIFDHEDTVEVYEDWVNFPAQSLLGDTVTRAPYLATLLPQLDLLPEAVNCLCLARQLVRQSIPLRSQYYDQYHLRSWDAGWYQLKDFWKECYRKEFDTLKQRWYELRDRLAPGVFDFGWLRR